MKKCCLNCEFNNWMVIHNNIEYIGCLKSNWSIDDDGYLTVNIDTIYCDDFKEFDNITAQINAINNERNKQ